MMAATIVAGWDKERGGQVYGIPLGGTMVEERWMVDGSGSTYIWGICDHLYKDHMTRSEAESFVTTALSCAMSRDSGSGGMVRLTTLTAEGTERKLIKPEDMPVYLEELPSPGGDIVMQD